MKRKMIFLLVIALMIIIAGAVIQNNKKQKVRETMEAYNQKANRQDIVVDLSDNPYFRKNSRDMPIGNRKRLHINPKLPEPKDMQWYSSLRIIQIKNSIQCYIFCMG